MRSVSLRQLLVVLLMVFGLLAQPAMARLVMMQVSSKPDSSLAPTHDACAGHDAADQTPQHSSCSACLACTALPNAASLSVSAVYAPAPLIAYAVKPLSEVTLDGLLRPPQRHSATAQ
jgi:hypothetical protein